MFIQDIDQKIKKQVKALELKPQHGLAHFKKREKRYYAVPCKTKQGRVVFLKMLISNKKEDAQRLKKEIEITKFLEANQKWKRFNFFHLIRADAKNFPYWLLRQYLSGKIIGYDFKIYKNGLSQNIPEKIAQQLHFLQKMKPKIKLTKRDRKDYLRTIKFFEKKLQLKEEGKFIDFNLVYNFFEQQKKYFNKKNDVLAHGDFVVKNIILHQNKLYLIDWELIRIDNLASDAARMWIQTYRYPFWRSKFLISFLNQLPKAKQNDFKELFRLTALVEAISEFANNLSKNKKLTNLQKSML